MCLDSLAPENHLLRKIEKAIDFDNIYSMVEHLYCEDNGRPSADPVVLVKMALLQHLYGIRSPRRTRDEVEMNIAYRWFIGYDIDTQVYTTTNRDGYQEYKSNPAICKTCPKLYECTHSKSHKKIVQKHIWSEYVELAKDFRHSPEGKATYTRRSQTIERVFADAKEKHGMRYTLIKGLERVKNSIRLKFAVMNLIKLAMWA